MLNNNNNNTLVAPVLLSGDMLVHRNGKVSTVLYGTNCGDICRYANYNVLGDKPGKSFSYLSRFDENLIHESKSGLDIVKVYRTKNDDPTKAGDAILDPVQMLVDTNLIWDREASTTKQMTIADIEAALGYKVQIVG